MWIDPHQLKRASLPPVFLLEWYICVYFFKPWLVTLTGQYAAHIGMLQVKVCGTNWQGSSPGCSTSP